MNCCYSNPKISKHVILNNTIQPPLDDEELQKAPEGWNPNVSPPVSFLNLRPYYYLPNQHINVNNQNGMANPMTTMNQASINRLMM